MEFWMTYCLRGIWLMLPGGLAWEAEELSGAAGRGTGIFPWSAR